MDMINSCSTMYLVFKFELSLKFRHNCYNLNLLSVGRVLNLKSKSLMDMIWKGWAAVYLFLEMLEFWRNLSLKIFKITHDEFLYDESLNSYHSHIYMLARLWATHLLFTAYEHWVWSSYVDPYELVMRLKSRFTWTFTHTCYFYSGSTHPHTSTQVHLQIHLKLFYSCPGENSQKYLPIPVIPMK